MAANGIGRQCLHRKLYVAVFICVALVMFVISRVLHYGTLPTSWQYAPSTHVHFLYTSVQNFDVNKTDAFTMWNISISVDQPDANTMWNIYTTVNVVRTETAKYINKTYSINKFRAQSRRDVDAHFLPSMTTTERIDMLVTLDVFIQACNMANITYFLCGGTLLGSYRHHGFIPWDDDVDVAVNASDWRKLRHVLSHVPGYSLFSPNLHQWKFFPNNVSVYNPPCDFKWPNVDIFFFTEDSTYMWGLTDGYLQHFFSKKSEVFPLQLRPFENLKAAVPCNTPVILRQEFDIELCVTLSYDHKERVGILPVHKTSCRDLYSAYPFVFRTEDLTGTSTETLKVGDRIIHEFISPGVCSST